MASTKIPSAHDAQQIAAMLRLPEIVQLTADLGETRWTGRPGYPIRTMIGAALVKAVYALPTWTRTARLVAEHVALREVIGDVPSHWACYRFAAKLRDHGDMLTACIDRVLAALREAHPEMGETVAIDRSDVPAYANGHKHVGNKNGPPRTRYADPDAGWGHRSSISTRKGGGFYRHKIHTAVCTRTELPVAWTVRAANDSEQEMVGGPLDCIIGRGFATGVAVMDKGYDGEQMYTECESRDIRPVIALKETRPSRPAGTCLPHASTGPGRSPGPTPSAARPSGAARRASAGPRPRGSRPAGFTRSSRMRRSGGRRTTGSARRWNASSADSRPTGG